MRAENVGIDSVKKIHFAYNQFASTKARLFFFFLQIDRVTKIKQVSRVMYA